MSRPPLLTRDFALAASAVLMLHLAAFLFLHLPGFLQSLGAGEAEIGRIMSAQALGALLAWPFIGWAIDAYGRRAVTLAGAALFIVAIGLYLAIGELGPFVYTVRLLDGVASTMWYAALFTHGADLVPAARRTEGLAIFGASALIPIGLGAQFGDAILAWAGYRELFFGALGFALLGLVLCLPMRDVPTARAVPSMPPARGLLIAATEPALRPVWCAAFAFFVCAGALFTFLKTFVAVVEVGRAGGFFTAYALTAVLFRVFLGWVPDRLGARRMLGPAVLCYALGFVVLAGADTPATVLAAGAVCGIGHGYTYPVLFSLVVSRAATQRRGAATAFFAAIDWIGLLLAGPLFGQLIEVFGYGAAFSIAAAVLAAGTAQFYTADRGFGGGRGAHERKVI